MQRFLGLLQRTNSPVHYIAHECRVIPYREHQFSVVNGYSTQAQALGFNQPVRCTHAILIHVLLWVMFIAVVGAIVGPVCVQFDDITVRIADEYRRHLSETE